MRAAIATGVAAMLYAALFPGRGEAALVSRPAALRHAVESLSPIDTVRCCRWGPRGLVRHLAQLPLLRVGASSSMRVARRLGDGR